MSEQSLHHQNTIRVGGEEIEYQVSNGLFDHTLYVAAGHFGEWSPKDIVKNGPPEFFESAFSDFKELNPGIKDEAAQRKAFARFIEDTAGDRWKNHHKKLWTTGERERQEGPKQHSHD